MNEHLRERINRKLDTLSDERGYQILDYIEFLDSKYAERQQGNAFTKFTEAVEDRLRAGKVSASAIAETMGLLNKAANVLNGAVAAGKSVATDIVSVAQNVGAPRPSASSGTTGASTAPSAAAKPPGPQTTEASSPAHDLKKPGSGEERL
ncbi:MAG TPA: hypothetical protein VEB19_07195 [Gemmatimonadaceae bacterium]|nr:hypothetical protein [Gemmatimonadaceae bacterium]